MTRIVTDGGEELARVAARAAHAKGGHDIVILDVGPILAVISYFVIVSAGSDRAVRAIVEEVEAQVAAAGLPKPRSVEGRDALEWVLLNYDDVVVHVFLEETRRYYDLERLWADAAVLAWQDAGAAG